jgi:nucleotide-binding universal stress UspA family protein
MMVLACQLATERHSSIDALYVIEVPLNLPIDASLPEERERARQVLTNAAQAADQFKVRLTPVIVTARSAGRAIVEEAIARRSDVIVLGSQGKRRIADRVFGRTIDHVLNNLPCEAIINVIPKAPATGSLASGVAAGSVTMIPPSVVPPAAGVSAPAGGAQKPDDDGAVRGGARRRARGLPLSRYLPSRPGPNGSERQEGAGEGAATPKTVAAPARDPGGSDPAAH